MKRCVPIWIAVLSLLVSVPLASGQGQSKGKAKKEKKGASEEGGIRLELTFSIEERKIIVDWFSDETNTQGLPPGLAKRDDLPPGLQKQLVRNGTLPPGLQKKLVALPSDLSRRLPPLPEGMRRVILSGSVILLDDETSRILDLVEDVIALAN